jgi:hypothetical protein
MLSALGEAALDAALAGLVLGAIETMVIAARASPRLSDLPIVLAATAGFTIVPAMLVGAGIILAVRLLLRHPALAAARAGMRVAGARRVEVLATAVLATLAVGIVWWTSARVATHAHLHYKLPAASGVLVATTTVAAAIAALLVVTLLGPPLGRRLGRLPSMVRLTAGRYGLVIAGLMLVASALAIDRYVAAAVPSWDPVPSYVRGLAAFLFVLAAVLRPVRRAGRRWTSAIAVTGLIAVVAAPAVITMHAPARGAVLSRGVIAPDAVNAVAALFDDDGDGFPDVLGMVDCDDDDPAVQPGAIERAGNGRDDDCRGGDADPAALAAARASRASAFPGAARHDLVLVTIDSLRADHTSLHAQTDTTPTLAALAARGTVFEHAHCASPSTRFAVPALLFGRHPHTLPFTRPPSWIVLDDHALPTLATELRGAGYRTAAILARAGLPLSPPTFAGFDEVVEIERTRPERNLNNARAVADHARAWLATPSTSPRLLWVHFIDPHYPYEPSYAAEIRATDAALASIIDATDATRTIVAVTGDHGESFLEHQHRFHGSSLYDEETRVPLVIAVPGGDARRIATPVSHVDVTPTLLDLVGLATPAGMSGASLAGPLRRGEEPPARSVITALLPGPQSPRPLIAVHDGGAVLLHDLGAGTVEAYDLVRDPSQRAPIRSGALVDRMRRELDRAVTRDLAMP